MSYSLAHFPANTGVSQKFTWVTLVILLLTVSTLAMTTGDATIPISQVPAGLLGRSDEVTNVILRELRLPRLLLALGIGAMLGTSGAALQGYLRNPLAEPAILGTSNAAALGAVIALYFGLSSHFVFALPFMAGLFAVFAMVMLFAFSFVSTSNVSLILAGIAISALAGAGISLALNLSTNPFAAMEISFWLLGSVEDLSMQHALIALPFILLSLAALFTTGRALDALTLGEETARSLGFNLLSVRIALISAIALGVGAGVAVAGAIGFVGLVAPHIARGFFGSTPSRLLLPSALIGALLLTGADILVRIIPTTNELKLGVVTALLGAPVLIYVLYVSRQRFS